MIRSIEECRILDISVERYPWKHSPDDCTEVNRHRITSRNVARVYRKHEERQIARRRRFNIAARIAAVYDLFLGREAPHLPVEHTTLDAKSAAD